VVAVDWLRLDTGAWRRDACMPPSSRNRHASRSFARQRDRGRFGRQQRCDRELQAKWRWTCSHVADQHADAAPGSGRRARRDHDGYSVILPGRPVLPSVLPDGLAHAEKISEMACSRVTDESVRVTPRVPYRSSHIHKLTLASLKQALNPESSDFRLGRCRPSTVGVAELMGDVCGDLARRITSPSSPCCAAGCSSGPPPPLVRLSYLVL